MRNYVVLKKNVHTSMYPDPGFPVPPRALPLYYIRSKLTVRRRIERKNTL